MNKKTDSGAGRELFDMCAYMVSEEQAYKFQVGRGTHSKDRIINVNGLPIGGRKPVFIAGPCAVDDEKAFFKTVESLVKGGIRLVRANLFKFRTLPGNFQGLEEKGVRLLKKAAELFDVSFISEVMDLRQIDIMSPYVAVFQVGARSMMNTSLLKALGKAHRPVLLKRGFSSTLGEYLAAAEYIAQGGNDEIILCERGIRTFEPWMRFMLDVPGIALLKKVTPLPIIADVSHSLGRTDVAVPIAKAALAAGASGIMVEVHSTPRKAMSDSRQQMNPAEFFAFKKSLEK
jgi:3-deoxy-7-phosphoheptulonate synthase